MRHIFNLLSLLVDTLRALFSHGAAAAPVEQTTPFPDGTSATSAEEEITHYSPEYCSLVHRYYEGLKRNDMPDVKEEFIRKEMKKCNDVRAACSKKCSPGSSTVSA